MTPRGSGATFTYKGYFGAVFYAHCHRHILYRAYRSMFQV